MMCVLPLLSGGISSWRQGRGNPLRHTTTHTDTGVSLDSPSSSTTTTTSMPLGLLRLLFFYPNPHPPPSLPRPGRLSSAPSLLFIFSSASLCCLPFSVSLSLFLFIRPLRITFTNALKRSSLMREREKKRHLLIQATKVSLPHHHFCCVHWKNKLRLLPVPK